MQKKYPPSKVIKVGKLFLGGGNPILVQSMTKTDTRDVTSTIKEIKSLEDQGADLVRIAIKDEEAISSLVNIKREVAVPLIGDIHFSHKLAILAIKNGIDKLRLNPSNIKAKNKIKEIAIVAKEYGVPIRVGANAGSLKERSLEIPLYKQLVNEALKEVEIFNEVNFENIVVSLKTSDILETIKANELLREKVDLPIHVGITEAGPLFQGLIKGSIGIGYLLLEGIGDTIRYSLSDSSINEVTAAFQLLNSLNLRKRGVEIISCPTCGRLDTPHFDRIVKNIEFALKGIKEPLKVAIMGCVVNGPGEAKYADIGIAAGRNEGILFIDGHIVKTIKEKDFTKEILQAVQEKIKKLNKK